MFRISVLEGESVKESVKTWLGSRVIKEGQSFKAVKTWIHENYTSEGDPKECDIALIELEKSITFTPLIRYRDK